MTRRPDRRPRRASGWKVDEEGSAIEAVIIVPAAMLVVFLAVQMCLWGHAASVVQAAADQGDRAACLEGGTLAGGVATARRELSAIGATTVDDSAVQDTVLPGDLVRLSVRGRALSILPWLRLPVAAVAVGTRQEFRVSG